jgi:hypothetical protein
MILRCGSAPRLPDHQPDVRMATTVAPIRVVEVGRDLAAPSPTGRAAAPDRRTTEAHMG